MNTPTRRSTRTLADVLRQVSSVPDFAEIEATTPTTLGNFSTYPLHCAAVWNDTEAIRLLFDGGAKLNQKGEHGYTPLMEAVSQGNMEAIELLIELGATAEPNDQGDLPSELAEVLEHKELALFLRAKGY